MMILFRVDGNSKIGIGHIMRCLTIADAFYDIGEQSCFLTSSDEIKEIILSKGYKVCMLESQYNNIENEKLDIYLELYKPSIIVVDSYYVTYDYLKKLHSTCKVKGILLVYIDDIYKEPYSCDYLLNYNIYADNCLYNALYRGKEEVKLLLGTRYVPLRKEFQNKKKKDIHKNIINVFVSTGGADVYHIAFNLAKFVRFEKFIFHFIVSSLNSDYDKLKEMSKEYKNIVIYKDAKNIAEIMQDCDVAISASGSTLYELCAMQVPTITYVIADNQIKGAETFFSKGIMKYCGDIRDDEIDIFIKKIVDELYKIANDYEERLRISSKMKKVIDGQGANRIVKKIINTKIDI